MGTDVSNRTLTLAAFLLLSPGIWAQQNVPAPVADEAPAEEAPADEAVSGSVTSLSDRIKANSERAKKVSADKAASSNERRRAYNEWADRYTQGAYSWHQTSTVIIFVVVIFVVVSGVLLAAWQLHAWISRVKKYDAVILDRMRSGQPVDGDLITGIGHVEGGDVTMQSKSLAVSSPYVGVVILGLSMGFFMAYLLFVYPIIRGP